MDKKINIGLFGFGCVGQGLYEVLNLTNGLKAEISKICIKNPHKKRSIPDHHFTTNSKELLFNPNIQVIVELIDDSKAAFEIVKTAMEQGKAVVSANKKMIAEHFLELIELQKKYQVPFLYEAACCASIPIIRNLEEYYDNDLLTAFDGIINGSTNYILSKVNSEKISFQQALLQAQENGFAESNPTLDIEAFDPRYKLSILIAHAFGIFISPEFIVKYGIQNLNDFDLQFAKERGYQIKLVATGKRIHNELYVAVLPKFIKNTNKLSFVHNEYNGVVLTGAFSDQQFFVGKGAGAHPTGSAVLSDISALTYQYKYEYKKLHQINNLKHSNQFILHVYLRFSNNSIDLKDKFLKIDELYYSNKGNYIQGAIDLNSLNEIINLQLPNIQIITTEEEVLHKSEFINTSNYYLVEYA